MADEIRQTLIIEAELSKIRGDFARLKSDFASAVSGMQNDARRLNSSVETGFAKLSGLGRNLGSVFGALGVGFGAVQVVGFLKGVVDSAGALKDLEQQTGISAQTLSGLKSTLEQNGDTVEAFATAFGRLVKGLAAGDDASNRAVARLKQIGFSADELKNAFKDPEAFLGQLAKRLAAIESPTQRMAIAMEIAGRGGAKFAASLVAAADGFDQIKKSGLSQDQIDRLDDFGDAITKLSNSLQILAATPLEKLATLIALITGNQTDKDKAAIAVRNLGIATEATARAFGRSVGEIEGAGADKLAEMAKNAPAAAQAAATALVAARKAVEGFNPTISAAGKKPRQNILPDLPDTKKADKAREALESYRESLIKLITAQQVEEIKLTRGEEAAREAALAYEVLDRVAKLAAEQVPIPPTLQAEAEAARATLRALGADVATLGEKNLTKLRDGALAGADGIDILKQSLEGAHAAVQAFADAANEGVGLQFLTKEDAARIADAKKQLKELQKEMTLDVLSESDRRREVIEREFKERMELIRKTADTAEKSEAEISDMIFKAAEARNKKLEELSDDTSEFMRRAYERGFDAVADGLTDLLDNGAKSFGDFAEKIRKTLNSLLADAATIELKKILLGANYGSGSGGQLGGLLGQLLGGGGATVGYGTRPAGVAGPSMANGGFFSNVFGSLLSIFYHDGGLITPGAIRMHGGGEVPIIAQEGEYMINRRAARAIGRGTLDALNMVGGRSIVGDWGGGSALPPGGRGGDHNEFHFHGVTDADSFRRSRAQVLADLTRAVEKGRKHL